MCPAPDHGTSAIEDPRPDDHHNDNLSATATEPAIPPGADVRTRARTMTSTEEIDNTIIRPGSVRINVKGAFIVDPDSSSPRSNGRGSPTHHETSDIRLPNHHAVVSHIAVDVCALSLPIPALSLSFHLLTLSSPRLAVP